ncbi:Putative uncharacterized protein [Halomonas sp. R57-5]|nr:Putative uncharacterized protein [Halomonas sp. R57-5]
MKPYPDKLMRKLNLPHTESALVQRMTPCSAHADDLAQLSTNELVPEKNDSISSLHDMHHHRREN